ncbi:glutamyl-Q tRNA(Asp) ligase [Arthrobacter sp. Soil782]|uniref:tRNA glutamyl-Q(34) synthetase GluQRS n=1 Tax=Arthrobacter sp. Soil782 TaxID=1736410 RepID=UPI0006F8F3B4|nr:tRNA glutamyl-Q(34) synthetase GluQRS [Arthrobacter sp. Soil782]KRF09284.1 glutamyl-Q tRNA(Asp) ligase [Arthrobacter sp. Soil782]
MTAGRFAPSPTGELHVGNLRTAILAWLFARSTGRQFLLRVEDLDRVRAGAEEAQLAELTAVGLTWDGEATRQSDRQAHYDDAVTRLRRDDRLFECFCTRRDIAEAASAPHVLPGHYPGTCRNLSEAEREAARRVRPAALRLRTDVGQYEVLDLLHGEYTGAVDAFVVVRNDGVPAYNLAVVVDDAQQGIDQVVRGEDLLSSAPRQAYLGSLLGLPPVEYAHVPLALNPERRRLAKRDGAVTLEALAAEGWEAAAVRSLILRSLGLPDTSLDAALGAFDPFRLPREPWIVDPPHLSSTDAATVPPNR